jgi:hypothetical protein
MSTSAGESTASSDPGGLVICAARADDIDRVLDLLMHYDQPRAAFEPWYEHEPAYRPDFRGWRRRTAGWWRTCGSTRASYARGAAAR